MCEAHSLMCEAHSLMCEVHTLMCEVHSHTPYSLCAPTRPSCGSNDHIVAPSQQQKLGESVFEHFALLRLHSAVSVRGASRKGVLRTHTRDNRCTICVLLALLLCLHLYVPESACASHLSGFCCLEQHPTNWAATTTAVSGDNFQAKIMSSHLHISPPFDPFLKYDPPTESPD